MTSPGGVPSVPAAGRGRGLLVAQLPHPVHALWASDAGLGVVPAPRPRKGFAGTWRADRAFAVTVPLGTRVVVAEGGSPASACVAAKRRGHARAAILLAADETWARLRRGVPQPLTPYFHRSWRRMAPHLDGAIAAGPQVAEDLEALFPRLAVEVVRPFVLPEMHARLLRNRPALDRPVVLHPANREAKNGTRLLLQAWPEVRRQVPGATLRLFGGDSVGLGDPAHGVEALGFVDDLAAELAGASLFALPGQGQAYPVSVLEAMTAGVPALVSDETGNAELARAVSPGLVVRREAPALAAAVAEVLRSPLDARRALGREARARVASVDPTTQRRAFVTALDRLLA